MSRDRVLLAIDCSYQVYRASAAHPELVSSDGTYTGGLYGFLMTFAKTVRETEATDVVICLDSKPYRRSLVYPEYKQIRKKEMDPDLKERFTLSEPLVHRLMDQLGIPMWAVPGFESDDLVGQIVRRHRSRFKRVYAASNDSDLYQLLDAPQFAIYKDHIKSAITRERLLHDTGLTPAEYMLATALQGTHNDIAGIKGCGEILSQRAVKEPTLMRKYRDGHSALIDRNLALIKLPHDKLPRDAAPPARGEYSDRVLYRYLARLDIDCTASMVYAFDQIKGRR